MSSEIQAAADRYHDSRRKATERLAFDLAAMVLKAMHDTDDARYYRLAEKFADAIADAGY